MTTNDDEAPDPLQRLIDAHPRLFRGKQPVVTSSLPRGWWALTDRLCSQVESLLPDKAAEKFQIMQVKEKWGKLCFYFSLDRSQALFADIQHPDGRSRLVIPPEKRPDVFDQILELTIQAGKASEAICMDCGQPGKMRTMVGKQRFAPKGYVDHDDPKVPQGLFAAGYVVCLCEADADRRARLRRGLDGE